MANLERRYWAHSDPAGLPPGAPGALWQPLRDHLRQVGALAERFALAAGGTDEFGRRARAIGLLHDFGKYTDDFQRLLRGEVKKDLTPFMAQPLRTGGPRRLTPHSQWPAITQE